MNKLFFLLIPFFSFAQQFTKVDFIQCDASVALDFESKSIDGTISYKFQVLSEIDSIRIDAKNMYFKDVAVNGKLVNYKNNKKELILFEGYKKGRNEVSFSYKAMPKQTLYFFGVVEEQQIWTQGQGKYTSNWLPSFDDVNEKVVFNLFVNNKNKFQVVSNGILKSKKYNQQAETSSYQFKMKNPMSSYLVMLAIGNFNHQTQISASGIPLEMYYQPKDSAKFDFTYKDSKTIFDFLEKEIGVKYPWKIYRQITV
jgi:aminopeptidase N